MCALIFGYVSAVFLFRLEVNISPKNQYFFTYPKNGPAWESRMARGGSCGLLRKARRGSCVGGGKVGRGAFSSLGSFYVTGCVVPLLVGVYDASFELFLVRESGIGLNRFLSINAALV